MSLDLAKHVFAPGEGEYLEWGGPAAGQVTIMIDPANSGPTGLCVLSQTLDPGSVVPIPHHVAPERLHSVPSFIAKFNPIKTVSFAGVGPSGPRIPNGSSSRS